jgi:hypothetical protein
MAQIATTEADRTAAVAARRATISRSAADVPADMSTTTQMSVSVPEMMMLSIPRCRR